MSLNQLVASLLLTIFSIHQLDHCITIVWRHVCDSNMTNVIKQYNLFSNSCKNIFKKNKLTALNKPAHYKDWTRTWKHQQNTLLMTWGEGRGIKLVHSVRCWWISGDDQAPFKNPTGIQMHTRCRRHLPQTAYQKSLGDKNGWWRGTNFSPGTIIAGIFPIIQCQ